MRPRTVIVTAFLALTVLASGWHPARAQGLHSVFSRDGIDVWAVGDDGSIVRSFDGGTVWTAATLGAAVLRDVAASGLTVVVVSDGGTIWRSTDSGGAWASTVLSGTPTLHAVVAASSLEWLAAGSGGTIVKSVDGGASWTPLVSGTTNTLRALRFTDPQHGWAVGDAGTVLRTSNGGDTWTPVAVSSAATLYDVDANGASVWVVGADGTARRSTDDGAQWSAVNLKLDAKSDVRSVWLETPSVVFLAGGGGFIRRSLDGGQTWLFPKHAMRAPISSLYFAGSRAWACNDKNPVVLTSTDQDTTWSLPAGTNVTHLWTQKLPSEASIRGNTLCLFPFQRNAYDVALGTEIFRSRDDGEHWTSIATVPLSGTFNAYVISPKDSNVMVVAVNGAPQHIARSANGGQTWTTTLSRGFGDFGIPIEMDPDRPDTLYFGGDSSPLYRSTDAGATWNPLPHANFRSPCDIVAVPDSDNIILVGDGITGSGRAQYYKSSDAGQSFTLITTRPTGSREIPGMACSRQRNAVTFGTNWGAGGVQRTPDYGTTWPNVSDEASAWGVDIARDDPNLVIFGVYGGGVTYLSFDGGTTFTDIPLAGSNYSFLARDRATIFALQSNGVWRLGTQYLYAPDATQSLTLTSPNGGEVWAAGSTHSIAWSATNLALARVEYRRTSSDPWQEVALVPGYQGAYAWPVPEDATTGAAVRIRDAWDSSPADSSNGTFTITVQPQLLVDQDPLDLSSTPVGYTKTGALDLDNAGTAPLNVTSVSIDNPRFHAGRTAFVIPAHGSDTLGVTHAPIVEGPDSAHVTVISDDPGSPRVIRVLGAGTSALAVSNGGAAAFALWQNRPNPFTGTTRIGYSLPASAKVRLEVFDLLGHRVAVLVDEPQGPGTHAASFGPGVTTATGERLGRLESGVYFYRLAAGRLTSTRRMLVMR